MNKLLSTQIENEFAHVKFDVSITDTIEMLNECDDAKNCLLCTIKDGLVSIKTPGQEIGYPVGPHGDGVRRALSQIARKYPNFETTLLFWKYDILHGTAQNYPIFSIYNSPTEGVYNPQMFFEKLDAINDLIELSKGQKSFHDKSNSAYCRYGLSGIHSITRENWFQHFKFKFSLFSTLCQDICDIKFFMTELSPDYIEKYLNGHIPQEIQPFIQNLPIFDGGLGCSTSIQNIFSQQFNSKINLVCEGNSSLSHTRVLVSLYNDGHIIRIGPKKYIGILESMLDTCEDYPLIATCTDINEHFVDTIKQLRNTSDSINLRKEIVKRDFSQDAIVDTVYDQLMLYNQHVKV